MKTRRWFELSDISTAALLSGIVGVGLVAFIPSYFLVLGSTSFSMHMHALFMYLWLGGLVCMALLIRSGHTAWHRRIGYASPLLVVAMLYSGYIVTLDALGVSLAELDVRNIARKRLPVITLVAFTLLYLLALAFRKHPRIHFRLMLSTAIILIGPALRRILLMTPWFQTGYVNASFQILGVLTLGLIAFDFRRGYFKTPYFLTLGFLWAIWFFFWYWRAIFF